MCGSLYSSGHYPLRRWTGRGGLLQLKRKTKKDGWDIHEKNAYHGSARWAKEKEILDGNFIAKSEKDVRETFLQSLKGRDVEWTVLF